MGATYGCSKSIIILIYEHYGLAVVLISACIEILVKFQAITSYILFHLTYYNIAHRMDILKSLIVLNPIPNFKKFKASVVSPITDQVPDVSRRIQKAGYLLDLLANASNHLQNIFSFSALIILTTTFLSCTIGLFIFIHEIFQPSLFHNIIYLELVLTISNVLVAVTIILSADLPCHQVRLTKQIL